jgi:hypothetical protein
VIPSKGTLLKNNSLYIAYLQISKFPPSVPSKPGSSQYTDIRVLNALSALFMLTISTRLTIAPVHVRNRIVIFLRLCAHAAAPLVELRLGAALTRKFPVPYAVLAAVTMIIGDGDGVAAGR